MRGGGVLALERTIQTNIVRLLEQHGHAVIKIHGSSYTRKGEPDLIGCMRGDGRMFTIEVKRPGNRPTVLQAERLRWWKERGAISFWADSVERVIEEFGRYGYALSK